MATQDIADKAVRLLLDKTWAGKGSVGVLGPEDLSYHEIAELISQTLGIEVKYESIAGESLKAGLVQFGATDAAAAGLVEIYSSMKNGVFNMVPRTPETASPTTFSEWCEAVFKPAFLQQAE